MRTGVNPANAAIGISECGPDEPREGLGRPVGVGHYALGTYANLQAIVSPATPATRIDRQTAMAAIGVTNVAALEPAEPVLVGSRGGSTVSCSDLSMKTREGRGSQ
jgi:hypothetical protein